MQSTLQQGMSILPLVVEMQQNGMPASRSYFESLLEYFDDKLYEIGQEIRTKYNDGEPFNPNSDPQVLKVIKARGLETRKKTPKGDPSVSKKSIEYLRHSDEFVDLSFTWKEIDKQRSTFCVKILECLDPAGPDIQDVVGDVLWTSTATRRLSMKKVGGQGPSLLTIPSRQRVGMLEGLGMMIRKGFIAPEGYLFGSWDLSQIEVRVAAHYAYVLTGDTSLMDAINSGLDLHSVRGS